MGAFAVLVKVYWTSSLTDKEEVHLVDSEKFVIGRAPESTLVLADPKISRKHLGVLVNRGKIYLKDLGGGNGTYMDEKRLSSEEVHPYKLGKPIKLGNSDIFIKFELFAKKMEKGATPPEFPAQDREVIENYLLSAKAHFESSEKNAEQMGLHIVDQRKKEADALFAQASLEMEDFRKLKLAEANSLTDAAREEAQKILFDMQELTQKSLVEAHDSAQKTLEQAEQAAQQTLAQAQTDSEKMRVEVQASLNEAQDSAKKIQERTQTDSEKIRSESESILIEAQESARKMLEQAQTSAEQVQAQALDAAKRTLEQAKADTEHLRTEAHAILAEAEAKASRASSEALDAAKQVAKDKANQILGDAQREAELIKVRLEEEKVQFIENQKNELDLLKKRLSQDFEIEKEKWAIERQVRDQVLEDEYQNKKSRYGNEIATLESHASQEREKLSIQQANETEKLNDSVHKRKEMEVHIQSLQTQIRGLETNLAQKKFQSSEMEKQMQQIKHEKERTEKKIDDMQARMTENAQMVANKQKDLAALQQDMRRGQDDKIDALKKINQEIQMAKEQIHHEAAKYRNSVMAEIDQLKAKEKDNLHRDMQKNLSQFTGQREKFIKRLSTEIEGLWLATENKTDVDQGNLQKRIKHSVQQAFDESYIEMSSSMDKDVRIEVKEISKKRKVAVRWVASASCGLVGLYFVTTQLFGFTIFKEDPHSRPNESAVEAMSRQQIEKQAARKYSPTQDLMWKNSYTDNILFTQGYLEAEKSAELEQEWIRKLHQVFVKELKLDDEVVARLVGVERSMLSRLEEERNQIHPDFVPLTVNKMKEIEKDSLLKIREILKTEHLVSRFNEEAQKYWQSNLSQLSNERLPASVPENIQ